MLRVGRSQGGRSDPFAAGDAQTDRDADAPKSSRGIPAGRRPREGRYHAGFAAFGRTRDRGLVQAARGARTRIKTLSRRAEGFAEISGVGATGHRSRRDPKAAPGDSYVAGPGELSTRPVLTLPSNS